jgi:hypothetical protein
MPVAVIHALDFFIWSALDDHVLAPTEARPFSDDERFYNAVLNKHMRNGLASTAEWTEVRFIGTREPRQHVPYYFPDEDFVITSAVAKDLLVMQHFATRHDRLREAARFGTPIEGPPELPSSDAFVNPDAYTAYFTMTREQGLRFAEAPREHREAVTVIAPMAAVITPNTSDASRVLFDDGWVRLRSRPELAVVSGVIGDCLDPEALLPSQT